MQGGELCRRALDLRDFSRAAVKAAAVALTGGKSRRTSRAVPEMDHDEAVANFVGITGADEVGPSLGCRPSSAP